MDIGFVVNSTLNMIANTINLGCKEISNILINYYGGGGISETLKQNGISFSQLYATFLLKVIKDNKILSKQYEKDVKLIKDCIDKYGGFD